MVSVAGTNDLNRRNVTTQNLIDPNVDRIAVLREFSNVKNIFVCKITLSCDRHAINSKVSEYNELFKTYSMKTYVLLHFEHKNDVTIIVKLCMERRAVGEKSRNTLISFGHSMIH